MLRALCRSYRSAAVTGFKSWNWSSSGVCGGELARSCSSTGSKDGDDSDNTEPATTSSPDAAEGAANTPKEDAKASQDGMVHADAAAGGAKGGGEEAEREATVEDIEWEDVIDLWANAHACYIEKDRSIIADAKRKAERDNTLKLYAPDGSIESAYDDTSQPLYDSRVWLHMFEGPGGKLLPSYCKRTGAAQYMYDFTVQLESSESESRREQQLFKVSKDRGFTEWRVEQNALISDDAKCMMFKLWAPGRGTGAWTDEMLAHAFKIRVQRALAIVKIKELEFQAAETNVENLNKLQKLLGLDPQPSLKELRKPKHLYTTKHLTAWFDEWIQLYELLPHIIHPDSIADLSESSEDSSDPAESADTESATAESVESDSAESSESEARLSAASGDEVIVGESGSGEKEGETVGGDADSGKGKKGKGKKGKEGKDDGDARVRLTPAQVDEVVALHNKLTKAANGETKQIACHQDLWRAVYHHGTGEKFIPFLQTMPSFEERPTEDAAGAVGEYALAVEESTRLQDRKEIEEFRRNLSWALLETGKTIQRAPRKRGAKGATLPSKPDEGWPILVTPLHSGGRRGEPFVATPDTNRRALNADEELYLSHFKIEPRIFSRPRRHAPFTNDTLHMFTQRKPNPRHDLYNPPYQGSPKPKTPKSGPDRREQRKSRMAATRKRKDLAPLLAGTRL